MECLRSFIGLLGCTDETPGSGLYINSLPGLSSEVLEAIANSEKVTGATTWSDIQTRALKRFHTDVLVEFRKRYRLKTIQQSMDLGRKLSAISDSHDDTYKGICIETNIDTTGNTIPSALQSLYVESVSLFVDGIPENHFDIVIFDTVTGAEIYRKEINTEDDPLVDGWNKINLAVYLDAFNVAIVYEATEVDTKLLPVNPLLNSSWTGCLCNYYGQGCWGRIRGCESADRVSFDGVVFSNQTAGLSAVWSIVCRYDNLVCANRDIFALPLWYLYGVETQTEVMFSHRLNRFTTSDLSKAGELRDFFMAEYEKNMAAVIGGIDMDLDDACLVCNEPIRYVESRI